MTINPGVWLIMEDTGDLIARLPATTPAHLDEVVLSGNGDPEVTYKVEKVRYVCEYENLVAPGTLDTYEVHGRTDLLVSVVTP